MAGSETTTNPQVLKEEFTVMYLYNYVSNLFRREEGQGMAEYGLILALIAVVVIAVLTTMGTTIQAKFQEVVTGLS